ncbi:MAG TPA: YicC/YloC family endoribonuclease [Bacteroidales bacterium]|nr:YicC/YloC family endoribonuclease [Bacteroidales bacterium]
MLYSMTGYGKNTCEVKNKKVTVELRSLNSKQLDLNIKLSSIYREKEPEIRNILSAALGRGKVDFFMFADQQEDGQEASVINKEVFRNYYDQLSDIAGDMKIPMDQQVFSALLKMPEIFRPVQDELNEASWNVIRPAIENAVDDLVQFRQQEGAVLENDIMERIHKIEQLLEEIPAFEDQRIAKIKGRITNNLGEFVLGEQFDKDRFEQEIIYYLEKLDITEEKVRLKNHCVYFVETVNNAEMPGKKLGFISQEIGREINTIGSKANDADIQKLVVQMKDELEKIKEQLMNVL